MLPLSKLNSASRIFLISGILIFPISILEIYFGEKYSSSLLIVDSYHGFIDATSAILFSVLLKIIYRKSKRFPWGLYNLESLAILMSSAIIVFLSMTYLFQGLNASYNVPDWLASIIWGSSIITLIVYYLERKYRWIEIVRTDLVHSKLDIFMEIIGGIAILSQNFYFNLAVIISIIGFILADTIRQVKEAILSLIGASCDCPIKDRIHTILKGFGINVSNVYVRRLGSFFMVYVVVTMPSRTELRKVYRIRKKISRIVYSFDSVALVDVKIVPQKVKNTLKIDIKSNVSKTSDDNKANAIVRPKS